MEWLEGETLDERLQSGPLGIEDTLVLARRVTDGLGILHRRGIVHRDLKPSNLFLPRGSLGEAKILDFGVARVWDGRLTRTGAIIGTPLYMSPEQAGAADQVSFGHLSLGTVLFECLAGASLPAPQAFSHLLQDLCKSHRGYANSSPRSPLHSRPCWAS
jgi:serine/threonine-protein kinase